MFHTLPTKPNDIPCRGLVPASIKTVFYFFHHEIQFFPIVTDPNLQRLRFRVYAIVRLNCGRTGNFFCLVVKQQSGVNRPWEGLFNINATKLPADPSRYTIETTTFKPAPSDLLAYSECRYRPVKSWLLTSDYTVKIYGRRNGKIICINLGTRPDR